MFTGYSCTQDTQLILIQEQPTEKDESPVCVWAVPAQQLESWRRHTNRIRTGATEYETHKLDYHYHDKTLVIFTNDVSTLVRFPFRFPLSINSKVGTVHEPMKHGPNVSCIFSRRILGFELSDHVAVLVNIHLPLCLCSVLLF